MLMIWINNSMANNLQKIFIYVANTQNRWNNLQEKCSQSNTLLVFQLKSGIFNVWLGEDDLTFTTPKVQKAFDELLALQSPYICRYEETNGDYQIMFTRDNLVLFLNGLNTNYDLVRELATIHEQDLFSRCFKLRIKMRSILLGSHDVSTSTNKSNCSIKKC